MEIVKSNQTLILFVVVFIPGFVSTRVLDLLVPGQVRDYQKKIYEVLGYSFFTYALWSPLLIAYADGWMPPLWSSAVFALLILLVTPALLTLLYLRAVREWLASYVVDPCPSAWDWAFKINRQAMVLVHLRDGRKLGGTWDRTGFVSSYPVPADLFLSEVWAVDQNTGVFQHRVPDSLGLIVYGSDIEMLEFFDLAEIRRKADERKQQAR